MNPLDWISAFRRTTLESLYLVLASGVAIAYSVGGGDAAGGAEKIWSYLTGATTTVPDQAEAWLRERTDVCSGVASALLVFSTMRLAAAGSRVLNSRAAPTAIVAFVVLNALGYPLVGICLLAGATAGLTVVWRRWDRHLEWREAREDAAGGVHLRGGGLVLRGLGPAALGARRLRLRRTRA